MSRPPSYEDALSGYDTKRVNHNVDSKVPQRLSIRDEVGLSRSQHVASLTSKLLPQIQERAMRGLSKTTLLLLPSDQAVGGDDGQLVGFPEDEMPIVIQLEGRYDATQFWSQQEALDSLQSQLLAEVSLGGTAAPKGDEPLSERPETRPKTTFWSRKASKAPESRPVERQIKLPVTVEVKMDQVNFRTENEFGLLETLRGRAILVEVDVR